MAEEKFLTVRETALILGISEKEVTDLVEIGGLPAYRIGGVYLRFKKEQVQRFKKEIHPPTPKIEPAAGYPLSDRVSDFFYFNDFYIIAALVVLVLLYVIFRG